MRRRDFITFFGGVAATWLLMRLAQQGDGRTAALLGRTLQLQANDIAAKIGQFIVETVSQVGWTTQLPWSAGTIEQRRFDALRLLRQVPAVTELALLDASGHEQLRVSRLAMDVVGGGDPKCLREVPPPAHQVPPPVHQEVGGIGIGVIARDGLIRVVTPLDGTPAARAGILANDIITKVDGEPVQGLTLKQAVEKMHGPVGTKITLTIVRMGEDKPIDLTITREPIRILAAEGRDASPSADLAAEGRDASPAADSSKCEPEFSVAMAKGVYYGPVYLRRESEPYMTLSLAGTLRESGVSVAEVNLKLVWDLIVQLQVGERGIAYLLDAQDRVIVHPGMLRPSFGTSVSSSDGDPTLFRRDLSGLAQVQAARAAGSQPTQPLVARDINGREVLSGFASVAGPGWHVFVELPLAEADTAVP